MHKHTYKFIHKRISPSRPSVYPTDTYYIQKKGHWMAENTTFLLCLSNRETEEENTLTMMQDSSTVSFCTSFSFYTSVDFTDAAVKIAGESRSGCIVPDLYSVKVDGDWEDDVDFEFVAPKTTPLREDDLFFFPAKPNDTVPTKHEEDDVVATDLEISRNLLHGEWNIPSLSSPSLLSSESNDGENLRAGGRRSKSKSKGSSSGTPKRWRFKDLLMRSQSEGGDATSIFTNGSDGEKNKKKSSTYAKRTHKTTPYGVAQGDKRRKSYLPYRQDLIGVFAAVKRLCH
ncbi:PREDICTED: uncharacterized protein LOC104822391 [Tarenaya hassleriana]|uniref:uncharacterized protein LOC104822391 n=1 Tax=Tarenaya hassleriana TaxID=28532 RepID=UPI00053C0E67|nr:PREDICTED: uncharacterized protein LOC104822391 [Tarenaya hassleriana]